MKTLNALKSQLSDQSKSVVVITAHKLDDDEVSKIKNKFGKDRKYEFRIDDTMLGGIIIRSGRKTFDGSVSSQVNELKHKLIQD